MLAAAALLLPSVTGSFCSSPHDAAPLAPSEIFASASSSANETAPAHAFDQHWDTQFQLAGPGSVVSAPWLSLLWRPHRKH